MKKSTLLISALMAMALMSCGGQAPVTSSDSATETAPATSTVTSEDPSEKDVISLYRQNSRFVVSSILDDGSVLLPTYHHKDKGDVPYVRLQEFLQSLNTVGLSKNAKAEKLADHLFAISSNNIVVMTFNTEKQILTIKRFDAFEMLQSGKNRDVYNDVCIPNDIPTSSVHSSEKSRYIGEFKDEVYDLGKYHMEAAEQGDGIYLPLNFLTNVLFRVSGCEMVYNGLDFFFNGSLSAQTSVSLPGAYSSCYAKKGEFAYGGKRFKRYDPVGEEKRRFANISDKEGGEKLVSIFSFGKDGKVELRTAGAVTEEGTPTSGASNMTYNESEEGIFVTLTIASMQGRTSTFKIPNEETYFGKQTRSKETAEFTLDLLRFQFENIYGLKEKLYARYGISSFDELIDKKHLRQRLLSLNSMDYDEALCEFLLTYIDDGHTKYPARSLYSGLPEDYGTEDLAKSKQGERRGVLFDRREAYTKLRTKKMVEIDPKYEDASQQVGLFFEGETAVVRFDSFIHTSSTIDNFNDGREPMTKDITMAMSLSSPDAFYLSFEEIKKHDEVKRVVFDLTCNGGGMALTLPYLAATWTDDPTFITYDSCADIVKEFHYNVDLNRNGVFGEKEDTFKGQYDFYLLTSDFSFSCGNGLPTMAKADGVKLIGKKSGGGACPVATVCDGSGTLYNTSMPLRISSLQKDGTCVDNDDGNPVDYEIDETYWYDLPRLNTFLSGIEN